MARLQLKAIRKSFDGNAILKGISIDVHDGEFLSLVGESGCGKSTLLRIISGLETPDSGEILIDDRPVTREAPKARNIAMVFQDYALYPHMTVGENMAMPLIMACLPLHARLPAIGRFTSAARQERPEISAKVLAVAGQLRIEHLLDRRPAQLSGGQRQRVALGRALVRDPGIFLMDEPLSNLDAKLRVEVRKEITELHAASGLTFVYVTHDQTEAMTMSDRVALLQKGTLLQVGAPGALYAEPVSADVARFIGSPEINFMPVSATAESISLGTAELPLFLSGRTGDFTFGLRPEALHPDGITNTHSGPDCLRLPYRRTLVEDLGHELLVHGRFECLPGADIRMRLQKPHGRPVELPQAFHAVIAPEDLLVFDTFGKRIQQKPMPVRQGAFA